MKRKYARKRGFSENVAFLPVLLICFLCAGLGGCLFAAGSGEEVSVSLSSFLNNYLTLLDDGLAEAPSVWSAFWEVSFWPLLVFVFGFTRAGPLIIPLIFCIRGFLLSYAIASFYQVFGLSCTPLVLAVFGVTALVSVPLLFMVGYAGLSAAADPAGRPSGERRSAIRLQKYVTCLPACGGLIALAVFLQWSVVPQLLQFLSEGLLTKE